MIGLCAVGQRYRDADRNRILAASIELIDGAAQDDLRWLRSLRGGQVFIGVEESEGRAVLLVQDTGSGIAPDEEILVVQEVDIPAPGKARIHPSIECQECGEAFMEVRGRTAGGKIVCEECYQKFVA